MTEFSKGLYSENIFQLLARARVPWFKAQLSSWRSCFLFFS